MPTNDFLPFATAGGAGVLTQSEYAALAARLSGFVDGIAEPTEVNKVWRQASVMAAMIGQFLNDYGALDALDDGNAANLLRDFARTLQIDKPRYAGTFGGTANALTANLTPAPAALVAGLRVSGIIAVPNTGATTFNLNSLGIKNVVSNDAGQSLVGGEFRTGKIVQLEYDGTSWRLLTPSFQAFVNAGSFGPSGSLGPTGTTNWTVPAGVTRVRVRCWAGGGGGGGAQANPSAASGAGAGGYCEGIYSVTPGQVISVTAGAGGSPGAAGGANNGTAGGSSSFGAFCTAVGGGLGGGAATGGYQTTVGLGGSATGGNIINSNGTNGNAGAQVGSAGVGLGGAGGNAFSGAGAAPTLGASTAGASPGGGGAGGANGGVGGAGGPGIVVLEW